MDDDSVEKFSVGERVELNPRGLRERLGIKDQHVWKIAEAVPMPDSPIHAEIYKLDPPHPFGPISPRYLQRAVKKQGAWLFVLGFFRGILQ
jgi:hypothetical protein